LLGHDLHVDLGGQRKAGRAVPQIVEPIGGARTCSAPPPAAPSRHRGAGSGLRRARSAGIARRCGSSPCTGRAQVGRSARRDGRTRCETVSGSSGSPFSLVKTKPESVHSSPHARRSTACRRRNARSAATVAASSDTWCSLMGLGVQDAVVRIADRLADGDLRRVEVDVDDYAGGYGDHRRNCGGPRAAAAVGCSYGATPRWWARTSGTGRTNRRVWRSQAGAWLPSIAVGGGAGRTLCCRPAGVGGWVRRRVVGTAKLSDRLDTASEWPGRRTGIAEQTSPGDGKWKWKRKRKVACEREHYRHHRKPHGGSRDG